ncbi:MAG: ATP-binding protein [Paramuribaculum sp.]|nr:ATP-binding protein [Paramuribaculum sp.]
MPHSEAAPRVVVLCGVSGSGKTHYAHQLEERGYTRLSPDLIVWSAYGSALAAMPFEQQKPLFADAAAELEHALERLLDSGGKAVIDATMCRRSKRDSIRRLCAARGIVPQLVYLKAPLSLIKQRLADRTGSGPDDQIVSDSQVEIFYSNFEAPGADEEFILVEQ